MDEKRNNAASLADYCQAVPYENFANIDTNPGYVRMDLSSSTMSQLSMLIKQTIDTSVTGTLASAYTVVFPQGLPEVLTPLHKGGFGTMIQENGRFVGTASLYSLADYAAILDAFNAMAYVTGQFYLTQINEELNIIRLALDSVLKFLYGDKKAELMAEVSFVQYAYKNYNYIMRQEAQRLATIVSLQESRKVAMKDIEFYISDLASAVNGDAGADIANMVDKAFQIKESLDTALQLYVSSGVLEAYYAQNFDKVYISNIESIMSAYISKCEKQMLSSFGVLCGFVKAFKPAPLKRIPIDDIKQRVDGVVNELKDVEESPLRVSLRTALHAGGKKTEYVISTSGAAYLKVS